VFNRSAVSGASISGAINITVITLNSVIRSHNGSELGFLESKLGSPDLLGEYVRIVSRLHGPVQHIQ